MASIAPLPLRFVDPTWTSEVPSPPHDALDPEARRNHLAKHPRSYLAVTRAPEDAEPGVEMTAAELLEAGRAALNALLDDEVFGPPAAPAYHLYRLTQGGHRQTGLVAGVSVADYDSGIVRVHEQVNRERARHLAKHLEVVGVQSSPIALAFDDVTERDGAEVVDAMTAIMAEGEPFLDFVGPDGLRQQLWSVDDSGAARRFEAALRDAAFYLIDGHHRAAAASEHHAACGSTARASELMLTTLFPLSELRSQAFHRILGGIDVEGLETRLRERFSLRTTYDPAVVAARADDELAMATWHGAEPGETRPRWLLFAVPLDEQSTSPLDRIDPVRLNANVLAPLVGIDESGPDRRLRYRPGLADEASIEAMTVGEGEAVFLMRPIANSVLVDVSDRSLVMPPKSTYFLPKVRSGLMLRGIG